MVCTHKWNLIYKIISIPCVTNNANINININQKKTEKCNVNRNSDTASMEILAIETWVTIPFIFNPLHNIHFKHCGFYLCLWSSMLCHINSRLWILYIVSAAAALTIVYGSPWFSLKTRAFKFPHVIRVRGLRICNNRIQLCVCYIRESIRHIWSALNVIRFVWNLS